MKKIIFTFVILGIIVFVGCEKGEIPVLDCTNIAPTYTTEVKTILDTKCATAGCHNADRQARGLDFSEYEISKTSVEKDQDEFLGSIQHVEGYSTMPRNSAKLSDTDIQTLYCWVQNGMLE